MTTTVIKQGKRFKVSDPSKAVKTITDKHKGKDPNTMPQKDKDDLFLAVFKMLGLLDKNNKIK